MIGLTLSGGGSRAMAFHLGCLRALRDLEILDRINVISTISGGSVIGAYYAYTPEKSFEEFDRDVVGILKDGFTKSIFKELAKPTNFIPCFYYSILARFLNPLLKPPAYQKYCKRLFSRTDVFKKVLENNLFSGMSMESSRRNNIDVVVGSCELRTGTAFRFSNEGSGGWRFGEIENDDIDLAFAVTASAAYPIFLPAFNRTWVFKKNEEQKTAHVLLSDGGIYDNLGVQVLEPGRNPDYSLHTYPCDYIIVCNAGYGQEVGVDLPQTMYPRVQKSLEIIHRRVQSASMHRLHRLKTSGLIKGFAMPYLGQEDKNLPINISPLVSKDEVIGYPTDFFPMQSEWIEKLANRGEQLTRFLISYYLSDLL